MRFTQQAPAIFAAIVMAADLGSSHAAAAQAKAADDASKPYEVVTMFREKLVLGAIAVPKEWREVDRFRLADNIYFARRAYGDGVPEKDESGQTLTMGVVAESDYAPQETIATLLDTRLKELKARRLKSAVIDKESTEKLTLADGSEALLLTHEYTLGDRRTLNYLLLAKNKEDRPWYVSGVIEAGKSSKIPTTASPQAALLRMSLLTFCFDPKKVDTSKWTSVGKR